MRQSQTRSRRKTDPDKDGLILPDDNNRVAHVLNRVNFLMDLGPERRSKERYKPTAAILKLNGKQSKWACMCEARLWR